MSTIIEWYKNGGPIMNFILAVGVAGIAIFIERFYVIVIKSKTTLIVRDSPYFDWPIVRA